MGVGVGVGVGENVGTGNGVVVGVGVGVAVGLGEGDGLGYSVTTNSLFTIVAPPANVGTVCTWSITSEIAAVSAAGTTRLRVNLAIVSARTACRWDHRQAA